MWHTQAHSGLLPDRTPFSQIVCRHSLAQCASLEAKLTWARMCAADAGSTQCSKQPIRQHHLRRWVSSPLQASLFKCADVNSSGAALHALEHQVYALQFVQLVPARQC